MLTSSHNPSFITGAVESQIPKRPPLGQRVQLSSAALWGATAEGTMWLLGLLLCTVCVRWALNLVYTRCTKEGCKNKYGDVEQSVHSKASPKPLVVRGCLKPSGIIFISLPNPTLFIFFLVVVLDLDSTLSPFPWPSMSEECGDSVLLSASSSGAQVRQNLRPAALSGKLQCDTQFSTMHSSFQITPSILQNHCGTFQCICHFKPVFKTLHQQTPLSVHLETHVVLAHAFFSWLKWWLHRAPPFPCYFQGQEMSVHAACAGAWLLLL